MTAPAKSTSLPYRAIVVAVLAAGLVVSVFSYREGRAEEAERAEAEFARRAALRHALTREILGHYEDALFGLSALFTVEKEVTREEFVRATSRLEGRIAGVQAFEWVPVVLHAERAAVERMQQRADARETFQFTELGADGKTRRALDRPQYYPILYVHPRQGNEAAEGYDLMTGPTRQVLERARESRQMFVSHQVRLVQETGDKPGVVMILPVFLPPQTVREQTGAGAMTDEVFGGFLQCVFRVHELLDTVHSRQPDTALDMLFLDTSEPEAARRTLYYRSSSERSDRAVPTETEFHRGLARDYNIPFGQRDWRVIFRPQNGWMESQQTAMPILRSLTLLLLSGLLAGLTHIIGRRTETIRREVEERTAELAASRRQVSNMLHALPGMSYRCTYDVQLTVGFVSEGARQLTGWTAEEFMSGAAHFRECIHPEDLNRVRDATRAALDGRTDVEVEYRLRTKSGGEKWVLSRGRGVYDADGALNVFEGLAIDITAQKNAESARLDLERKVLEGQKLESLGLLAGGIAHDFNNLLSSILGNASMVRLGLTPGNAVDEQLRAIETASLRAAELCRQMLAYAGKGRFVVEPTNLTVLTEDLMPLLKISIAHQATLTLNLERKLPAVQADAAQIRQIVMNLVVNATEAITDRASEIVISTGVVQTDAADMAQCVAGANLPGGEYVFLEVRDTGSGMKPEVLAKIFDPFFTTKFAGRGLGLSAVLGIVRGHNGALRVESTPGVGTSFRLLLPPFRVPQPVPKLPTPAAAGPWRAKGNVLVVDDEEQVRTVMVAMLKIIGLTPTPARDGESGLAIFRENPANYDLVVLDLLMPGMNGEQVFRALRALKPDVRVLLVSGYSEGDILGRLGGGPALGFLPKPFTRAGLEQKLRALLEDSAARSN